MLTLGMAWLLSHIIHTLSCSQKVQSFEIAEALKQPPGVEPGVEYQTWLAGVSPWTKWWYILWMVYFIQPLNLCVLFVEGTCWKWESPYILKFHQLLIDGSENHSSTASCKPSHVLTNRMHISLKTAWLNQIILAKNWVPQQPYGLSSFPRCITISTDWGQDSPVRLANICQYRNSMKPVEIKHIVLPILLDFKLNPHIVLFWRISPLIMFNPPTCFTIKNDVWSVPASSPIPVKPQLLIQPVQSDYFEWFNQISLLAIWDYLLFCCWSNFFKFPFMLGEINFLNGFSGSEKSNGWINVGNPPVSSTAASWEIPWKKNIEPNWGIFSSKPGLITVIKISRWFSIVLFVSCLWGPPRWVVIKGRTSPGCFDDNEEAFDAQTGETWNLTGFSGIYRRKFRSQTSDNMDRWKAEMGRVREKRKSQKKEDPGARKGRKVAKHCVGKSRNTVFFQWFVAPEGRKVGSLKRRVRSQLARWEMKNCTPLWREAHF